MLAAIVILNNKPAQRLAIAMPRRPCVVDGKDVSDCALL